MPPAPLVIPGREAPQPAQRCMSCLCCGWYRRQEEREGYDPGPVPLYEAVENPTGAEGAGGEAGVVLDCGTSRAVRIDNDVFDSWGQEES